MSLKRINLFNLIDEIKTIDENLWATYPIRGWWLEGVQEIQSPFGLVGFYGISTIVGYLMPNLFFINIKYIWFGLVGFYGISTIVGHLMPDPFFSYLSNIWFLNTFCRYTQLNDQFYF